MITKRTALVLGAGASWPYGFPLGAGLVKEILQTNPKYIVNHPGYAEHGLEYWLHASLTDGRLDEFRRNLADSDTYSIDAFLSNHPEFAAIGRALIAAALIPHEIEGPLFGTDRGNWCKYLKDNLGESYESVQESLHNLSVVTFNYDRSFEYYFYRSFCGMYGQERAIALMRALCIVHVHGQLGKVDFLHSENCRGYHPECNNATVKEAASQIKVISDELDDSDEFRQAHQAIHRAQKLVFLGFGYNDTNMRRLQVREHFGGDVQLCSVYGMMPDELRRVEGRFAGGYAERNGAAIPLKFASPDDDSLIFLRKYPVIDE